MSLTADSPVHSSSSDDFAAILDAELDSASDASPEPGEVEEKEEEIVGDVDDGYNSDHQRFSKITIKLVEVHYKEINWLLNFFVHIYLIKNDILLMAFEVWMGGAA